MINTKNLSRVSTQIRYSNSMYPIIVTISILGLLQNWIHSSHLSNLSFSRGLIIVLLLIIGLYTIMLWYNELKGPYLIEKKKNNKFLFSLRLLKSYHIGFFLFLVSEFMLFFALFWSFFHYSWVPSIEINNIWPSSGIEIIDWKGLSFFNTNILIGSSLILNWVESGIVNFYWKIIIKIILLNVILAGSLFLIAQYVEYTKLPFNIRDTVYSNIFYWITGLHLTHVFIGLILLSICWIRIDSN